MMEENQQPESQGQMPDAQPDAAASLATSNPLNRESHERRLAVVRRRVRRGSAASILLELALEGGEPDQATMDAVARLLRRRRSADLWQLAAICAALEVQPEGPLAREPLFSSVCSLAAMPDDRDDPAFVIRYSVTTGLISAVIAAVLMRHESVSTIVMSFVGLTICFSILAAIPVLMISEFVVRKRATRIRRGARAAACSCPSPIALDAVLKGYMAAGGWLRRRQRRETWQDLTFLLDRADDGYYASAPPATVPSLIRLLPIGKPPAQLLVLRALTAFGDGRAVPAVERLLKSHPDAEVTAAAQAALPVLVGRRSHEQSYRMLLRAGDAPSNIHTLMRAAGEAPVQHAELMRPAEQAAEAASGSAFDIE